MSRYAPLSSTCWELGVLRRLVGPFERSPLDVLVHLVEHVLADLRPDAFGVVGDDRPLAGVDAAFGDVAPMAFQCVEIDLAVVVGQRDDAVTGAGGAVDTDGRLGADQKSRRDLGYRGDGQRGKRKSFALIAFGAAGPCLPDDGDRVLEEAGPVLDAATEAAELELAVAESDAEFESVAGQQRQRGGVFGEADRVVQPGDDDVGADPHRRRPRCQGRSHHQR